MGVSLRTSHNTGLNSGLRQSISGGAGSIPFLEYVTIPTTTEFNLRASGSPNYEVDWGDGSVESSTAIQLSHTYSTAGSYTIRITPAAGTVYRPNFNNALSDNKILRVNGTGGSQLGTTLLTAWFGADQMTSFSSNINVSGVGGFRQTWQNCKKLTSFPLLDFSNANTFYAAWTSCKKLTSFPLIDSSGVTQFRDAWRNCTDLTSFPLLDTSSGTNFYQSWYTCGSLTSFPLIDVSNGSNFLGTWRGCSSLTSFPALDFSSATTFDRAWLSCTSLQNFPANMFDSTGTITNSNPFRDCWQNCALTAQSIENILVSLDTNGVTNKATAVDGGTNAAKSTWSTAANTAYTNLIGKGWTIAFNS
tara:strand:- start:264 stop:1346 length:1083 start_codon:yes stop_codon:yes gene_type:complete